MNKNWKDNFPMDGRYYEADSGILYCGDSNGLLDKISDNAVDLILTDPPYGVAGKLDKPDIIKKYQDRFFDLDTILGQSYRILKDNTRMYMFVAQKRLLEILFVIDKSDFKFHQKLIWHKPNLVGGSYYKNYDFRNVYEELVLLHKGRPLKLKKCENHNIDILKYTAPQSNYNQDKKYRIHQKPLDLMKHLICVSTNEGDIVLDMFVGSGTTLIASELLNRRWIGIDIDEEACKISKERLEKVIKNNKGLF